MLSQIKLQAPLLVVPFRHSWWCTSSLQPCSPPGTQQLWFITSGLQVIHRNNYMLEQNGQSFGAFKISTKTITRRGKIKGEIMISPTISDPQDEGSNNQRSTRRRHQWLAIHETKGTSNLEQRSHQRQSSQLVWEPSKPMSQHASKRASENEAPNGKLDGDKCPCKRGVRTQTPTGSQLGVSRDGAPI